VVFDGEVAGKVTPEAISERVRAYINEKPELAGPPMDAAAGSAGVIAGGAL
jgi:hypothetical protein